MREVELKLAVRPRDAARIASILGAGYHDRRIDAVYLDTPACDLARHELSLRLRRVGKRWIQSLKAGRSGTGGLHSRDEWEYERQGPDIDLALFAQTPLADIEAAETLHQRLVPAFRVAMRRRTWVRDLGAGTRAEVALDRGRVESAGRAEEICELEIECLEGDCLRVFDLAESLLERVALRPSSTSKAQRGYRLFQGAAARPAKARGVALDARMSPLQAARAVVASGLDQVQGNEEGVLVGEGAEFVHQARVGLRRTRSAIRMFRGAIGRERARALRRDLGAATEALGSARDWDVFASTTLPALAAAYGDAALSRKLARRAGERRRETRAEARKALHSRRYSRAVLGVSRWLSEPDTARAGGPRLPRFAAKLVRKRHRRAFAGIDKLSKLPDRARHRVRIEAKRLRYAVEALATVLDEKEARRYAKRLANLQDALGRANDCVSAQRLLESLQAPARFRRFASEWLGARIRGNLARLDTLAHRLATPPRF